VRGQVTVQEAEHVPEGRQAHAHSALVTLRWQDGTGDWQVGYVAGRDRSRAEDHPWAGWTGVRPRESA
jgi:hypothetical protein